MVRKISIPTGNKTPLVELPSESPSAMTIAPKKAMTVVATNKPKVKSVALITMMFTFCCSYW